MCELKWNKRDSFQKKSNWWQYATELMCEKKQEGQFSKNNNLLQYAIQLVCVLKWNKRGSFQFCWTCEKNKRGSFQKTTIYYSMLFNLCAYWNETRGTVFKKKNKEFITVCYSTCVRIEMKQEGQFSKKKLKSMLFNKRGSFHYSMLFNLCAYWNETRGTVFKKKNTIYYSMLFNLCAYWNETRGAVFKKNPIDDNMLLN